CARGAYFDSW
nr:immunoglobulin heavy chain junction region [Macaca mulatta]